MDISEAGPVRRALLRAMEFELQQFYMDIDGAPKMTPIEQLVFLSLYPISGNPNVVIIPQYKVGPYCADFAIFVMDDLKMIIECDGHDYHERTKEQAQHDKARDRYMTAEGWMVMRFTGSELWADANKCSREIERQIGNSINRLYPFPPMVAGAV